MELQRLYDEIVSRRHLEKHELKTRRRVAVIYENELDIMKIAAIGKATFYDAGEITVMAANVCPNPDMPNGIGVASFRLRSDGSLRLNDLIDVHELTSLTPTGTYISERPTLIDFPGCTIEVMRDELGVLDCFWSKGYFTRLGKYPVVAVSRAEMHMMQKYL